MKKTLGRYWYLYTVTIFAFFFVTEAMERAIIKDPLYQAGSCHDLTVFITTRLKQPQRLSFDRLDQMLDVVYKKRVEQVRDKNISGMLECTLVAHRLKQVKIDNAISCITKNITINSRENSYDHHKKSYGQALALLAQQLKEKELHHQLSSYAAEKICHTRSSCLHLLNQDQDLMIRCFGALRLLALYNPVFFPQLEGHHKQRLDTVYWYQYQSSFKELKQQNEFLLFSQKYHKSFYFTHLFQDNDELFSVLYNHIFDCCNRVKQIKELLKKDFIIPSSESLSMKNHNKEIRTLYDCRSQLNALCFPYYWRETSAGELLTKARKKFKQARKSSDYVYSQYSRYFGIICNPDYGSKDFYKDCLQNLIKAAQEGVLEKYSDLCHFFLAWQKNQNSYKNSE